MSKFNTNAKNFLVDSLLFSLEKHFLVEIPAAIKI
jgi:hypothetical protein